MSCQRQLQDHINIHYSTTLHFMILESVVPIAAGTPLITPLTRQGLPWTSLIRRAHHDAREVDGGEAVQDEEEGG